MNPCPHPVESAQRAARDLTMAWARNLTLISADQVLSEVERAEARSHVPTADEMAAKYIEVRDQILAAPVPPPVSSLGARP